MRYFNYTLTITSITLLLMGSAFSQDTTLTVTSNGNVGIGTTSPSEKLVVGDDFGEAMAGTRITIGNKSGNSALNIGQNIDNRGFMLWHAENSFLRIGTNGNINTLILKDGKIGMGNTTPLEKLDVNGNIAVNGNVDGVDVSDLKSDFDERQSNYVEFGSLDFPVAVDDSWTKTSPTPYLFTKSHDDSKIEVYFNGQVMLSNMNGVDVTQVRIRIDDTESPQFENYGVLFTTTGFPTQNNISIMAVFDDLPAGLHSVSIWAINRPANASSIVRIDPGNYGAKIIIKETW